MCFSIAHTYYVINAFLYILYIYFICTTYTTVYTATHIHALYIHFPEKPVAGFLSILFYLLSPKYQANIIQKKSIPCFTTYSIHDKTIERHIHTNTANRIEEGESTRIPRAQTNKEDSRHGYGVYSILHIYTIWQEGCVAVTD